VIKPIFTRFRRKTDLQRRLFYQLPPITGFRPGNLSLYELAFIHRSASIRMPDGEVMNNERLEYLGDAVLDAIISDFLFSSFPDKDEGFLSKLRSRIVKRTQLNQIAEKMGIHKLLVSNTEHGNGVKNVYGDALEALVGAVYLDRGFQRARKFVLERVLYKYVDLEALISQEADFKSRVIEWAQKEKKDVCIETQEIYQEETKVPTFFSRVRLGDQILGEGTGSSKKEAEQNAAEIAYYQYLVFH